MLSQQVLSFQFRALSRKTLKYQSRQKVTNICCVLLCPFLMVMIAGVLNLVIMAAFRSSMKPDELVTGTLRTCSRNGPVDPNGLPLGYSNYGKELKKQEYRNKPLDLKYWIMESAYGSERAMPCAHVLDDTYPESAPFFLNSNLSARDTTNMPNPRLGWFFESRPGFFDANGTYINPTPETPYYGGYGESSNNYSLIIPASPEGSNQQTFPWYFLFTKSGIDDIGFKNQGSAVLNSSMFPILGGESNKTGFLGNFPTKYLKYTNISDSSFAYVPARFFVQASGDPAKTLLAELTKQVVNLETIFYNSYDRKTGQVRPDKLAAQDELRTLQNMRKLVHPTAAVIIDELKISEARLKVTLQGRSIDRFTNAMNFVGSLGLCTPPSGHRYMGTLAGLSNALLASFSDYQISHNLLAMVEHLPWSNQVELDRFDVATTLGYYTYPFALTFLLPMFVLIMVKEKEDKILIIMRMNGLSTFTYYFAHYLHFMALQLISSTVFYLTGLAFQIKIFHRTEFFVMFLLLFLWANAMVMLSIFFSLLFSKSRLALILTFVLVAMSTTINAFRDLIFANQPAPLGWYCWPLFAFFEGLVQLGQAIINPYRLPYRTSDLVPGDPVSTAMSALVIASLVLFFVIAYLNAVLPTEYGVPKPWHFILSEPYSYLVKRSGNPARTSPETQAFMSDDLLYQEDNLAQLEDDDAGAERKKVNSMDMSALAKEYPLVIRNIRKVYSNGKCANKSMCLAVEKNTVFGLLGPNGAGKSTLIHMMTGLYPPTNGTAFVAGYDIRYKMEDVYRNIGVCPQHDILWDDLTCGEHVLFFARLRGCPIDQEDQVVEKALTEVNLLPYRHRLSKTLSGGEKRRLSIAIAVGGPSKFVYLDEPTTGLDPEIRRTIWDIIQRAKQEKTILLTTHSMEEADILADRIGIMALGVMRCLGTPLHLKRKYGRGFKLTISFLKDSDRQAEVKSRNEALIFIECNILPENKWRKLDQAGVSGTATYEFDDDGKGTISRLIDKMREHKADLGIEDWGVSQTSLEEVFINIVHDSDAEAHSK